MSGPIRKSIGLTHKRLTNYIEIYKRTIGKTTQPLGEIDNSSLITLYGEFKLQLNKIEKTMSYLESIHQTWIHFITSLTSDNERIRESRIYDDFLKEYGDYNVTLETAKDTIDEINNLKESYKSEILARKEEDNLSQDAFSSVKETPIMTATHSAPIAQSAANSTLAYLPPVTIPPFYGDITKWPTFWETFEAMIHSQNLADAIKFYHLKNFLRGEAAQLIAGLSTDSHNYSLSITLLHETYGNTEAICHKLRAQIISFSVGGQSASAMLKSHQFLLRTFRQLSSLGDVTDTTTYAQIIESRFPKHLMLKVIPRIKERPITAIVLLEKIGEVLKQETTEDRIYEDNRCITFHSNRRIENSFNRYANQGKDYSQLDDGNTIRPSSTFATDSAIRQMTQKCAYCFNTSHLSADCKRYSTPALRKSRTIELKFCFNCLGTHNSRECTSKRLCRNCNAKHHTSLCRSFLKQKTTMPLSTNTPIMHVPEQATERKPIQKATYNRPKVSFKTSINDEPQRESICYSGTVIQNLKHAKNSSSETLLMCAYVTVCNPHTNAQLTVLAFFDSGSNRSYITSDMATTLQLSSHKVEQLQINTFANKAPSLLRTHTHSLKLLFNDNSWQNLNVTSIESMTSALRFATLTKNDIANIKRQSSLPLPLSTGTPSILIGSDYLWDILKGYSYTILPSGFLLLDTRIGLMITGKGRLLNIKNSVNSIYTSIDTSHVEDNNVLEKFWNLESIGILDRPETSDDEERMRNFSSTVVKQENRYTVKWPWKFAQPQLPSNLALCTSRLHAIYKKLSANHELLKQYDSIFKEQLALNIIEQVDDNKPADSPIIHYLPHHPVITPNKTTTKIRIVYDASAKTKNNLSLNECLYRGPVLLPDLCGILLRFRLASIAISADVEKAFLQINLAQPDREVTRFLWLRDPRRPPLPDNIVTYRFTRVPFGIISSPFLLGATIQHHLENSNSTIAHNLWRNLYVDNVFMSATNIDDAKTQYRESRRIFFDASMNLREFTSNNHEFNRFLEEQGHPTPKPSKVLGIKWDNLKDTLNFSLPTYNATQITKRTILKCIASVYDPLGLISPVLVLPKLFLQKLWKSSLSWDDRLSNELEDEWVRIINTWDNQIISIERLVPNVNSSSTQLHCFVDASGHTYGAVAYLRMVDSNSKDSFTRIVFAKNRLCPIQGMSIPKLELMALVIGSRITRFLHEQLDINITKNFIWSDSSCALQWLKSAKDLTVFIKNRVREIRNVPANTTFRHLSSPDNPADIISRGSTPTQLRNTHLWWQGPPWLKNPETTWPDNILVTIPKDLDDHISDKEVGNCFPTIANGNLLFDPLEPTRYGSFSALTRIIGYVLFFILKCSKNNKTIAIRKVLLQYYDNTPITAKSQKLATLYAFKSSQSSHPPSTDEIRQVRLQRDELNIWRARSRLDFSDANYNTKFPIYLNRSSHITHLFILNIHKNLAHAGTSATIANLRQLVWIPRARPTVKKCIKNLCMACRRTLAKPYPLPPMPLFPTFRINESRPFSHIGIDYMGPLSFKKSNAQIGKIWIYLMTCLATRAIHCDIVFSLTAEAFIHILRRFISRRGIPQFIISDNGTQFKLSFKAITSSSLIDYCTRKGIQWKFITELAPWQGGVYERLIGVFKQSFRRAVGRRLLNIEDLITITYEIEAIVNSRPLTYHNDDISLRPLRPIDFILPSNSCISTPTVYHDNDEDYLPIHTSHNSLIKKWAQSQICANNFWNIWRNEYLNLLRENSRWDHKHPRSMADDIPKVGDIVLLRDDSIPRVHWKLAKIHELSNNSDIRSAKIMLPNRKILNRSINFLYPLEIRSSCPECDTGTDMSTYKQQHKPTYTQVDEEPKIHTSPRRSARIALLPPKTYIYFIYILCLISIISSTDTKCDNTTQLQRLIYLQECGRSGIAIYSTKDEFYCFKNYTCDPGTYLRISNNEYTCGFPCDCPKWASHCSTYTGRKIAQTMELLPNIKTLLQNVSPVLCSESNDMNTCSKSFTSKSFYQIQLFDSSLHLLSDIHLKISDVDTIDEPTCLGNDTTASGTTRYCSNFPCTNQSRKFCYYSQPPITYIIFNNISIPIKAWGIVTRLYHDFKSSTPNRYCKDCAFTCMANGSILVRRPTTDKLTIEICYKSAFNPRTCQIINNTHVDVIDIPQEYLVSDHLIDLKIWNKGLAIYNHTKLCSLVDICSHINCILCKQYILQCSTKLDFLIGSFLIWICFIIISTLINLMIIILKLSALLHCIGYTIVSLPLYLIRLLCYLKRSRLRNQQRTRFRISQRSLRNRSFLLIIMLIVINTTISLGCTEVSSIEADTNSCSITTSGSLECQYDTSTILTVSPNNQTLCLSLLDPMKQVVGSLQITIPPIHLLCRYKSLFFTQRPLSSHYPLVKNVDRQPHLPFAPPPWTSRKPHNRNAASAEGGK